MTIEDSQIEKTEYFECACASNEHTLVFNLDVEDKELYTSVFLHDYRSFFARCWVAIKYIFGYKCKYGHWDCTILKGKDIPRLISLLKKLEE